MPESYWNHRVLKKWHELDGELFCTYAIHEVHYRHDKPIAWTEEEVTVGGEDMEDIKFMLKGMERATKQPILEIYEEDGHQKLREVTDD